MYRVARYTCSSPLYFGEYDNYIDTGVLCKNLCGVGLKKINSYYEHLQQVVLDPIALVVSLGDGIPPAQPLSVTGQLSTYYLGNPKLDGRAAKDLLSVFQNMVALYNSAAVSINNCHNIHGPCFFNVHTKNCVVYTHVHVLTPD